MKYWRIPTFMAGLGAVALSFEAVANRATSFPAALWYWPESSWSALFAWRAAPNMPPEIVRMLVLQLVVHLLTIVFTFVLARKVDRHRWDWAVLALLFPPAASALAWVPPGQASRDRLGGVIGRLYWLFVDMFQTNYCTRCKKAVPAYLGVGDACPHCHVLWTRTKTGTERYPGEKTMYGRFLDGDS